MNYLDDTHMAQIDAAATRRAQDEDWRTTKPTKLSDEQYLRQVLEKIEQHRRDQETAAARHHAHAKAERRKYAADPEPITALGGLHG